MSFPLTVTEKQLQCKCLQSSISTLLHKNCLCSMLLSRTKLEKLGNSLWHYCEAVHTMNGQKLKMLLYILTYVCNNIFSKAIALDLRIILDFSKNNLRKRIWIISKFLKKIQTKNFFQVLVWKKFCWAEFRTLNQLLLNINFNQFFFICLKTLFW